MKKLIGILTAAALAALSSSAYATPGVMPARESPAKTAQVRLPPLQLLNPSTPGYKGPIPHDSIWKDAAEIKNALTPVLPPTGVPGR